ncbi:hypothetical protein DVH24_035378 [Malus domestica]|uniref:40S ribosomal protein S30 n=1 Tax=Malus domestica TaxID=3750 RepID=A0A498J8Z8_MALDO|nr:hypothetical protein DVH24_035378 [Malus domestica]
MFDMVTGWENWGSNFGVFDVGLVSFTTVMFDVLLQVLLGDVGVGKSSLVLPFVKGQFVEFQGYCDFLTEEKLLQAVEVGQVVTSFEGDGTVAASFFATRFHPIYNNTGRIAWVGRVILKISEGNFVHMAYQGATRFHAIYNKTVRSILDFESFRKLVSSPKSLFWVEMTRHPFGRFTLEWNWEVGFQVLTIMETMKSGRLWFFVFWVFSLQPRKPSVLKEPCFPFLSFCALRKQATLIEAFYLQITSNNLTKGWLNRIGKSGEGRGVSRGGIGHVASGLGYQDGVWVGLTVGHMGDGGDALRTHEAIGKVHGSLARASKVRGSTGKVVKQDKKKQPQGRAHKRLQYNHRSVTPVIGIGKKRGPNSSKK